MKASQRSGHGFSCVVCVVSLRGSLNNQTEEVVSPLPPISNRHGGNRHERAAALGCRPSDLLDLSASLVPFGPPPWLPRALRRAVAEDLCGYPDRSYSSLRSQIAGHHQVDPAWVMPGNGAAELFTWIARQASHLNNVLPQPGFADYGRALACWDAASTPWQLKLNWTASSPLDFASAGTTLLPTGPGLALWITNPHNPTGQLWSQESLKKLLPQFGLVVADEAFLPLVPGGEDQSLIPLLADHPNLVVVRSLTKMFAVAGLRLGYALAHPRLIEQWQQWRDPWPVNALAAAVAGSLLADQRWQQRVQRWVHEEGRWLVGELSQLQGIQPMPSAANYLLIRSEHELETLRQRLESKHFILLRTALSFDGLDDHWLRIGLSDRRGHRRLLAACSQELS